MRRRHRRQLHSRHGRATPLPNAAATAGDDAARKPAVRAGDHGIDGIAMRPQNWWQLNRAACCCLRHCHPLLWLLVA